MAKARWKLILISALALLGAGPAGAAPAIPAREAPAAAAAAASRIGGVIAGAGLWQDWSKRFVRPSGRVVDTGNHGVSHSEGQGYGMLLAVAADDRPAFDRLWAWTRANLQIRADKLSAWLWDPVRRAVSDHNNATDGDILIAWALAEAADLWNAPDYAAAGAAVAEDIGSKLIVDAPGVGPVLLPARFGFAAGDQPDGPVVNLSYWVFPAFGRLAALAPDHDWDGVRRAGLALVDSVQDGESSAPGDWMSLASGHAAPARRFPARAGYDALRIPLYLALSGAGQDRRLAASERVWPANADGLPILNLRTGVADGSAAGPGYRAIAALRACAASGTPYPREFYLPAAGDAYYPATLHMLALVGAFLRSDGCLDARLADAIRPADWRPRAAALPAPATVPLGMGFVFHPRRRIAPQSADAATLATGGPQASGLLLSGLALAGLLGALGWRRLGRVRPAPFVVATPEAGPQERAPAPRSLPQNPFIHAQGLEALEQRIEIAAAASAQWSRTVGVAYLRLVDDNDRALEKIVDALRARIRQSDAAVIIAPGELAVCLSLVADARDLLSIAVRLSEAVRNVRRVKEVGEHVFGLALYPAHGGSGAACVEAARSDFHAARPWLDYVPLEPTKRRPRRAKRKSGSVPDLRSSASVQ